MDTQCGECGGEVEEGKVCTDYFHQMLEWDFQDFAGAGRVHHLTVLCYYLQHPSHYSQKGLETAKGFLKEIVEKTLSIDDLYKRESAVFSSDKRDWPVSGTPEHHGSYAEKINWSMRAGDVVREGVEKYPENVEKWADSIYSDLKLENSFKN